jgi:hypothetical protein
LRDSIPDIFLSVSKAFAMRRRELPYERAAAPQRQRDAFEGKIPYHHCSTWLDPNIHSVFSSMVTLLRIDNLV